MFFRMRRKYKIEYKPSSTGGGVSAYLIMVFNSINFWNSTLFCNGPQHPRALQISIILSNVQPHPNEDIAII